MKNPSELRLNPGTEASDEITSVPGYVGKLPSKHFGGYIEVSSGRFLYYYLVLSEGDASTDPVVLWLNGGPGCSSFDGFVYEHGPFKFEAESRSLGINPYSWSKVASIIYLDSPAGVGFSYSQDPADYVTNDSRTAEDSNRFLREFFGARHPELAGLPFYVSGESYAGIYVPTLARRIVRGNAAGEAPRIGLAGYLVGNGCTDPVFDGNALVPYAAGKSLIDEGLHERIKAACGDSYWNVTAGSKCDKLLGVMDSDLAGLNIYDTLDTCFRGGAETRLSRPLPPLTVGRAWPLRAPVRPGPVANWAQVMAGGHARGLTMEPPCIDDTVASRFLNDAAVREALHARPVADIGMWTICSDRLNYTHDVPSMLPLHRALLLHGIRALIYSGDHDMCVPHTGSEAWTASLGYPVVDAWRPWLVDDGQVAGYCKSYNPLTGARITYATVKGAGHTVPEYKPKEALLMLARFLAGQPL